MSLPVIPTYKTLQEPNPQAVQAARCRICLDQGRTLMKLCECSGSIAYVHESCIIEWIQTRIVCQENMLKKHIATPMCEICKSCYSANIRIQREEISRQLFWQNVKRLTTFNTAFTLVTIVIYFIVLLLMVQWVYEAVDIMSQHNDEKEGVCMAAQDDHSHERLDIYAIAKYALVWGLFPLHYLYTSVNHLKKMKRFLIDGSKQIVADVTLKPKEVLKASCQVEEC